MRIQKQIQPGTVIHKEKPFVYILSSKVRTTHCDFCFSNGELLKCSGCQYVYYCGKVCQKEGWVHHKQECKGLKCVSPRILPDSARLIARLIRTLARGGDKIQAFYTETSFRMYKDLMSHYPDLKNDYQRMSHFSSICGVLFEFLGKDVIPNSAELMGMYGRMCVNSFNICNEEMQALGTGIYLGASVIDHSCKPNAVAIFQGTTLNIRAIEHLPYLDWSEIFISYIDTLNTRKNRQDELQSLYYFLCQCPKCLEPENVKETSGACCPNKDCTNCIDVSFDTVCSECNTNIPEEFIKKFEEVISFTESQIETMKDLAYLDVCKMCMQKHEGIVHKSNIKHLKILDMAFESSIALSQFHDAKAYGLELADSYYKYYGSVHPLTGLLHLKLGKIMLFYGEMKNAMEHLEKAYDILKITYGNNSSIFRKEVIPLITQAKQECSVNPYFK